MKFLISTFGSHGDILPFVAIAKELSAHGCEVVFYANPYFKYLLQEYAVRFVEVGTVDGYHAIFEADNRNPMQAFKRIAAEIGVLNREFYHAMDRDISSTDDMVISGSLLFAGHLLKETRGVKYALIHLSPSIFRSNIKPPRLDAKWITKENPLFIKNLAWWMLDMFFYEPCFTKQLNLLRYELLLPKLKNIFRSWIHEADTLIGLFPEWFARPQTDWAGSLRLTDFLTTKSGQGLPQEIEDFISTDKPVVVFTAGTANGSAYKFFATSMQTVAKLDIKAIFVSPFTKHIPKGISENILYVKYVPYEVLLPKISILVHHGGIGSTAVTMKSATPQIICPTAYDQFDNSARAVELGVAYEILQKNYSVSNVAKTIGYILGDKEMKERCEHFATKFQCEDVVGLIVSHLECKI
jgi:rhamnosyltransferase subunit B